MVLTPLVGRVARQYDWVARPRRDRWHDRPVALLGGVAVLGAVAVGLAASGALTTYAWPVWLGALLVFSVGLADDLWDVHPEGKLLVQVVATALLLYAGHGFWRGGPF